MAIAPLDNVRELTLREISVLWAPDLRLPEETVLRELRAGVLNIELLAGGQEMLDEIPPEDQLPDPETRVNRDWLRTFAEKNLWPPPAFWFPEEHEVRRPGRPTLRDHIVERFLELVAEEQLADTISAQGRVLHDWARENFPGKHIPEGRTIQMHIREEWHKAVGAE